MQETKLHEPPKVDFKAARRAKRQATLRKYFRTRNYLFLLPAIGAFLGLISFHLPWYTVTAVRAASVSENVPTLTGNLAYNAFGNSIMGDAAVFGVTSIPQKEVNFYLGVMVLVLILSVIGFLLDGLALLVLNPLVILPILMAFGGIALEGRDHYLGGLVRFTNGKVFGTLENGWGFYSFGAILLLTFLVNILAIVVTMRRRAKEQARLSFGNVAS